MPQLTENFHSAELRCPHCNEMRFSEMAVMRLQEVRTLYGKPMRINSGYRCPAHNAKVSGTGFNGPHTIVEGDSLAVDVGVSGTDAFLLIEAAQKRGVKGIGVQQKGPHSMRFIHLDFIEPGGRHPRPWVWSY